MPFSSGRHLSTRVVPFSFAEFRDYHSITFDMKTLPYSEGRTVVKRRFNEYLKKGEFPEPIVHLSMQHRETLHSYFVTLFIGRSLQGTEYAIL